MKKLSEILKIAKQYHISFGGKQTCMCWSIAEAKHDGLISIEEDYKSSVFCEEFVDSFTKENQPPYAFLRSAMKHFNLPYDDDTLSMVWNAVIDKLESEGK